MGLLIALVYISGIFVMYIYVVSIGTQGYSSYSPTSIKFWPTALLLAVIMSVGSSSFVFAPGKLGFIATPLS